MNAYDPAYRKIPVAPVTDYHEWHDIEIVQVDLPCGLRTYWYTRLCRYGWTGHIQFAYTTYQGRYVRFQRSSLLMSDWIPSNGLCQRIKLIVPEIEYALLVAPLRKAGSHDVAFSRGGGILTGQINRPKGFTGIEANHDDHPMPAQIRKSIIDAYQERFGEMPERELMTKIRAYHKLLMRQLYGIPDYKPKGFH